MKRQRFPVLASLFLLVALPGLASAQELGILAGRGSSDFSELGSPSSVSAQLAVPLDRWGILSVVGAYRLHVDRGERPGTICDFYWPAFIACAEEPVAHDTRLTQWEGGLEVGLPLTERIEARASMRRVRNTLEGSSEGAITGRSTGSFYPGGHVWSSAWAGGLAWRPRTNVPLALLSQLRRESLDFRGCVEDVGVPFCHARSLTTLEVGILLAR